MIKEYYIDIIMFNGGLRWPLTEQSDRGVSADGVECRKNNRR